MPDPNGNIFFNKQTLAFSFPLLLVCGTYAYFKYIPLTTGLPILGVLLVLLQIRSSIKSQQEQKLTNLDERTMEDLVSDIIGDEEEEAIKNKKLEEAKQKKKLQARLAQERKQQARKNGNKKKQSKQSDDLDEDDLLTFVKPAATKKKN